MGCDGDRGLRAQALDDGSGFVACERIAERVQRAGPLFERVVVAST